MTLEIYTEKCKMKRKENGTEPKKKYIQEKDKLNGFLVFSFLMFFFPREQHFHEAMEIFFPEKHQ